MTKVMQWVTRNGATKMEVVEMEEPCLKLTYQKRDATDLEEMENVAHENKWKDKNGNYIGGMPQL